MENTLIPCLISFAGLYFEICDSSANVLDHTIVNSNMLSGVQYTYHPFHHYFQRIANLEERILTADTILLYL